MLLGMIGDPDNFSASLWFHKGLSVIAEEAIRAALRGINPLGTV